MALKSSSEHSERNWADLMDALLLENFQAQAHQVFARPARHESTASKAKPGDISAKPAPSDRARGK